MRRKLISQCTKLPSNITFIQMKYFNEHITVRGFGVLGVGKIRLVAHTFTRVTAILWTKSEVLVALPKMLVI